MYVVHDLFLIEYAVDQLLFFLGALYAAHDVSGEDGFELVEHLAVVLAHVDQLVARLRYAHHGRVDQMVAEFREFRRFLVRFVGDGFYQHVRQDVGERQEEQRVEYVEARVHRGYAGLYVGEGLRAVDHYHGVGVVADELSDERHIEAEDRGDPQYAYHVEGDVGVGGAFAVGRGAQRRQVGGDGGADVFAQNEGGGGFELYDAGGGQPHGYAERGRGGLHDERDDAAGESAFEHSWVGVGGELVEPGDEVGDVAYGGEAGFHELQSEEDHAYAHGRHAGVAQLLVLHEEVEEGRDAHERQAVLAHVYDEYPAGDGGADVRPHYDAYGLLQGHYPGVDEPYGHDGGDG